MTAPTRPPRLAGEGRYGKVVDAAAAMALFHDGAAMLFGGFGSIGTPPLLIDALLERGVRRLRIVGNDAGYPSHGVGRLIRAGQVEQAIVSHIGSNPIAIQQMNDGLLDVTFVPQGTLAERIRAGGAGLGGILTDVGEGTEVEEGKQVVEVDGRRYLLEPALRAPLGIVLADVGDEYGNLVYRGTARNFNPIVAMAADVVVAEVRTLVPAGELDPDRIHTPGAFVDYIVPGSPVPGGIPAPKT
ncbi:MAG: 3-oxoacid CoA-transferase subunit A [Deinococcales bacterium]